MLQLFGSGVMALWLEMAGMQPAPAETVATLALQGPPGSALFLQSESGTTATLQSYLSSLSANGSVANQQGIWFQSGPVLLAQNQGTAPLPAASLTKVATTLAVLTTWGPSHQFDMMVGVTGPIEQGVLQGDLIVQGGQDPLFVWEEAIVLGNRLNQIGIKQVTGDLIIAGEFYMNFEADPAKAGELLKQGLDAASWPPVAAAQYRALPAGTPKPQLAIAGVVRTTPTRLIANGSGDSRQPDPLLQEPGSPMPVLRHRSLPLAEILKQMNVYSNNAMAEMLANSVGGAQAVAQTAADAVSIPRSEIQLINGSGLGVENRISPRAATAMLAAIQRELYPHQLTVADLFPVAGRDRKGTLLGRQIPAGAVVKTGTLNTVSALAGVIPTRDRGPVWFAIINRGNNISSLRKQQDQLLQAFLKQWKVSPAVPEVIAPRLTQNPDYELGAVSRNEAL